jgi:hypothetical protein
LNGLAQYRVVTPLLNLPILLLAVACLLPKPTRGPRHVLLATGALGLCFLMYFFYWTAAVIALGGYIATLLIAGWVSPSMRAERWITARAAGAVLAGGVLLGIPQVASNARTFNTPENQPILERLSRGRHLPAGSPHRAMYLKNAWAIGKIAIGAAAVLALGLRGLGLLWWLTASGFLLANSALVTGLEFENFHWSYVHAPAGEILILGAVVLWIARWARPEQRWLSWLWVVPAILVAIALAWRPYHALTAPESVENSRALASLRPLRPALGQLGADRVLAGPREARIALLFTRCAILYQVPYTAHSSMITDREVNERHALNAWLQGMGPADYARIADPDIFQVGPADEPSWRPAAIGRVRKEVFRQIQQDPAPFLERYRPDTLLLPASAPVPRRGGSWRLVQKYAAWSLWSKQPSEQ